MCKGGSDETLWYLDHILERERYFDVGMQIGNVFTAEKRDGNESVPFHGS